MSAMPAGGQAIGVDVGGTKTAVGLVDLSSGAVLASREIPSEAHLGADALLDRLEPAMDRLRDGRDVAAAVAVPELVSPDGLVLTEVVIPGLAGDLTSTWADLGVVAVESDVRAAAVAESAFGYGRTFDPFVFVSVGTGVSYCAVWDGHPWAGVHGAAILLGSGIVVEHTDGPPLEAVASGPGILARYRALGGEAERAHDVLARIGEDALAAETVVAAGRVLGYGLAEAVNLLDPAAVVVGGGLGSVGGPYWDAAIETARERTWADVAREVPVLRSELGPDAGLIGAALIAGRRGGGEGP